MPEGASRKRFNRESREADGGVPLVRFKLQKRGENEARWRPRAAVVAGGDPRRGRGIGRYLRVQGTFPRRLVVVVVAGEYHVDGKLCSGGRRLGWSRNSSERAAEIKLMRGLGFWWLERVTDGVGRRRWPHRSESWWRPRRIGAAGVGGGDLLEVLRVAWRGVGEEWG